MIVPAEKLKFRENKSFAQADRVMLANLTTTTFLRDRCDFPLDFIISIQIFAPGLPSVLLGAGLLAMVAAIARNLKIETQQDQSPVLVGKWLLPSMITANIHSSCFFREDPPEKSTRNLFKPAPNNQPLF